MRRTSYRYRVYRDVSQFLPRKALTSVRKPSCHKLGYASRVSLTGGEPGFDLSEHRLEIIETRLDAQMLRDYGAAPDFEDEEALDRAFAHAAPHPQRRGTLAFFLRFPRLDLAVKLLLDRTGEWDGKHHEILALAVETLEDDHPVAATILYCVLINEILARGRTSAYGHGARDFG